MFVENFIVKLRKFYYRKAMGAEEGHLPATLKWLNRKLLPVWPYCVKTDRMGNGDVGCLTCEGSDVFLLDYLTILVCTHKQLRLLLWSFFHSWRMWLSQPYNRLQYVSNITCGCKIKGQHTLAWVIPQQTEIKPEQAMHFYIKKSVYYLLYIVCIFI